ncbi:hypothetical protein EYF80_002208 [Liparis tanakae]|uniref:Uncharacterized protein n=1 Tax=Liparis tanakae TaxID=230148 RepID=A0A4Z2JBW3_9TELE|nr:hypothetical protein EYF80_002208 [Liparis tanakae]
MKLRYKTGGRQQPPQCLLRQHLLWQSEVKENPQVSTCWMGNYCWCGQESKSVGARAKERDQ